MDACSHFWVLLGLFGAFGCFWVLVDAICGFWLLLEAFWGVVGILEDFREHRDYDPFEGLFEMLIKNL